MTPLTTMWVGNSEPRLVAQGKRLGKRRREQRMRGWVQRERKRLDRGRKDLREREDGNEGEKIMLVLASCYINH